MKKEAKGWDFLTSKGTKSYYAKNGRSYNRHSDGSGTFYDDDGSTAHKFSDGSGYYYGEDGSSGHIYSDGSGYINYADGSTEHLNSDGSGTYHGSDGSTGRRDSDGNWTIYDSSGERTNIEYYNEFDDNEPSSKIGDILDFISDCINNHYDNKIKEMEYLEQVRLAEIEREEKIREKKERRRKFAKKHWKAILVTHFIIIFALFIGYKVFEYKHLSPIGISSDKSIGKDYEVLSNKFKNSGFSRIKYNVIYDLEITDKNKKGIVTGIEIKGKEQFSEKKKFPTYSKITITYHLLRRIGAPISSKEVKGKNYEEVIDLFSNEGFINIETNVEYDIITGWITDDGEVDNVTINSDKYFFGGKGYPLDAEVIITYHTYKSNKNSG